MRKTVPVQEGKRALEIWNKNAPQRVKQINNRIGQDKRLQMALLASPDDDSSVPKAFAIMYNMGACDALNLAIEHKHQIFGVVGKPSGTPMARSRRGAFGGSHESI